MQPSPSRKRTIDQVSPPANVAAYAASASPIPTAFSPAAMATGLSGAPGASPVGTDSPFTSALNQGSRMLSGISAPTPSSGMPMGSGYGPAQSPAQMQMQLQLQMQVQNGTMPMEVALQHMASMGRQQQNLFLQQHHRQQRHHQQQTIRPEVSLKMSLDSLLEDVLPALTRDGDAFYDAVEGSLSAEADSRQVQAPGQPFQPRPDIAHQGSRVATAVLGYFFQVRARRDWRRHALTRRPGRGAGKGYRSLAGARQGYVREAGTAARGGRYHYGHPQRRRGRLRVRFGVQGATGRQEGLCGQEDGHAGIGLSRITGRIDSRSHIDRRRNPKRGIACSHSRWTVPMIESVLVIPALRKLPHVCPWASLRGTLELFWPLDRRRLGFAQRPAPPLSLPCPPTPHLCLARSPATARLPALMSLKFVAVPSIWDLEEMTTNEGDRVQAREDTAAIKGPTETGDMVRRGQTESTRPATSGTPPANRAGASLEATGCGGAERLAARTLSTIPPAPSPATKILDPESLYHVPPKQPVESPRTKVSTATSRRRATRSRSRTTKQETANPTKVVVQPPLAIPDSPDVIIIMSDSAQSDLEVMEDVFDFDEASLSPSDDEAPPRPTSNRKKRIASASGTRRKTDKKAKKTKGEGDFEISETKVEPDEVEQEPLSQEKESAQGAKAEEEKEDTTSNGDMAGEEKGEKVKPSKIKAKQTKPRKPRVKKEAAKAAGVEEEAQPEGSTKPAKEGRTVVRFTKEEDICLIEAMREHLLQTVPAISVKLPDRNPTSVRSRILTLIKTLLSSS
ncbi:uncharacterized protein PFL1_06921 [Pseudozyma flocculosa PF-1]|uniref:Uncharacterized protein n=1 Tax=Pseudozyma flocculosa PF-1 TaxID=1277687 RepID=A0A061H185_9BASI|nr:uncharacterized protein PFL1_06921 [Pseudozyma flocculosa PF-1]EPQ25854.1 hypothetical protein PFL1_06921 [Pseudozyma flocculosa PF-1]